MRQTKSDKLQNLSRLWRRLTLGRLVLSERLLHCCFLVYISGILSWFTNSRFLLICCRKDTGSGFHDFATWTESFLREENADRFKVLDIQYLEFCFLKKALQALGVLKVLCEVVKSGSAEQVQNELPTLLSIGHIIQGSSKYSNNTIVRKLRTKLISRVGLRLLPARNNKLQGMTHMS